MKITEYSGESGESGELGERRSLTQEELRTIFAAFPSRRCDDCGTPTPEWPDCPECDS